MMVWGCRIQSVKNLFMERFTYQVCGILKSFKFKRVRGDELAGRFEKIEQKNSRAEKFILTLDLPSYPQTYLV